MKFFFSSSNSSGAANTTGTDAGGAQNQTTPQAPVMTGDSNSNPQTNPLQQENTQLRTALARLHHHQQHVEAELARCRQTIVQQSKYIAELEAAAGSRKSGLRIPQSFPNRCTADGHKNGGDDVSVIARQSAPPASAALLSSLPTPLTDAKENYNTLNPPAENTTEKDAIQESNCAAEANGVIPPTGTSSGPPVGSGANDNVTASTGAGISCSNPTTAALRAKLELLEVEDPEEEALRRRRWLFQQEMESKQHQMANSGECRTDPDDAHVAEIISRTKEEIAHEQAEQDAFAARLLKLKGK